MSRAVEWFAYGAGLYHWCCYVHEFNKLSLCSTQWYRKLFFSRCDFVLCKHTCITCAWLQIFGRSVWLNWVAKWVAAWKRSKNTGLDLILKVIGWLMVHFCQQKVFVKSICLVWQVCGTALCSGAVRDFVRGWPVTSVVRVHFLVILHKDYFDVTAQFLVYYNRIWRQISFSNFFRGGHGVFGLILAALLPLWTLS